MRGRNKDDRVGLAIFLMLVAITALILGGPWIFVIFLFLSVGVFFPNKSR